MEWSIGPPHPQLLAANRRAICALDALLERLSLGGAMVETCEGELITLKRLYVRINALHEKAVARCA